MYIYINILFAFLSNHTRIRFLFLFLCDLSRKQIMFFFFFKATFKMGLETVLESAHAKGPMYDSSVGICANGYPFVHIPTNKWYMGPYVHLPVLISANGGWPIIIYLPRNENEPNFWTYQYFFELYNYINNMINNSLFIYKL